MKNILYDTLNKYNENYMNIENRVVIIKNKMEIEERRINYIRDRIESYMKTENDINLIKKSLRLIDMYNNQLKLLNIYNDIIINIQKNKSEYTIKIDNIKREMEWLKKSKKDTDNLNEINQLISTVFFIPFGEKKSPPFNEPVWIVPMMNNVLADTIRMLVRNAAFRDRLTALGGSNRTNRTNKTKTKSTKRNINNKKGTRKHRYNKETS